MLHSSATARGNARTVRGNTRTVRGYTRTVRGYTRTVRGNTRTVRAFPHAARVNFPGYMQFGGLRDYWITGPLDWTTGLLDTSTVLLDPAGQGGLLDSAGVWARIYIYIYTYIHITYITKTSMHS